MQSVLAKLRNRHPPRASHSLGAIPTAYSYPYSGTFTWTNKCWPRWYLFIVREFST